jgi:fructoselysine-6-P-deglycase FrlB-like protein
MTYVEDELNSQPACWTRAAAEAARHTAALPTAGERVAIVGCGTSYFMAPPPSSHGDGRTTGSWPSPAPAPPPKCWRCSRS